MKAFERGIKNNNPAFHSREKFTTNLTIMSDNNFRYLCDPFRVEPFRLIYTVGFTYGYSHATLSGSNTKTYVHVKIGL